MERVTLDQVTPEQFEAAHYGRSTKGDAEVLEDLGIVTSEGSLLDHVTAGAEVAALLRASAPVDPHAGLRGFQLFRAVREELALRRAS